jgi:cytochrome c556
LGRADYSFDEESIAMNKALRALGVAGLVAMGLVVVPAVGQDGETPTIKEIMKKLHGGPKGVLGKLKTELKAKKHDWKAIQENSKEVVTLGTALEKHDPPKGEKEAFHKLAGSYLGHAKDLEESAKKENVAATKGALGKLEGSCKACHAAHKGK